MSNKGKQKKRIDKIYLLFFDKYFTQLSFLFDYLIQNLQLVNLIKHRECLHLS